MECYFCRHNKIIDWRDKETLKGFISSLAKIKPRRKTGVCAKHQRSLAKSIKRARLMGLLPFVAQ